MNQVGFTQRIDGGVQIGTAKPVEVIDAKERSANEGHPEVRSLTTDVISDILIIEQRKNQLRELFLNECPLSGEDGEKLLSLLAEHHDVFSLKDSERGETSWVEMSIDIGDATPVRQPPHRVHLRFEVTSPGNYKTVE